MRQVLVLGGTTEGRKLARILASSSCISSTLSLAGVTQNPVIDEGIKTRIGGFGGVDGLTRWIKDHAVTDVVDATHPFATTMTDHAWQACTITGVRYIRLSRAEWQKNSEMDWVSVSSYDQAIQVLKRLPHRETQVVFLAMGRKEVGVFARSAPEFSYIIRSVDPPAPEYRPYRSKVITARGPFGLEQEIDTLTRYGVSVLVCKNSGGEATKAKLEAARFLNIPLIIRERPPIPDSIALCSVESIGAVLALLGCNRK